MNNVGRIDGYVFPGFLPEDERLVKMIKELGSYSALAKHDLRTELGREPTPTEVARRAGRFRGQMQRLRERYRACKSFTNVYETRRRALGVKSKASRYLNPVPRAKRTMQVSEHA